MKAIRYRKNIKGVWKRVWGLSEGVEGVPTEFLKSLGEEAS